MYNETNALWKKIDSYNGQIFNLAMKEIRKYPNGPYNFEFAKEYIRGLSHLDWDAAFEWWEAMKYANNLRTHFNPTSSAAYDIEEFMVFVKEVRGW